MLRLGLGIRLLSDLKHGTFCKREKLRLCRGGSSSCTPCMIDILEVKVLFTSRWGEVIAKRKGVIARWCLKEA